MHKGNTKDKESMLSPLLKHPATSHEIYLVVLCHPAHLGEDIGLA